ncbi:hypothetical protein [Niveispirillum irakense]|uniref:hypothetical protein n=1 Tax=Niveispirillum irakense TaxID=34011 RepID=UPI0003F9166B|nr:hypothetical protein [Niveispirillum irakense]
MDTNRRLLVLGNGPSVKIGDFPKFIHADTIGMNAAYRHWDRIGWYPTHYACLDSQVVVSHADAIAGMIRADRFATAFLHWHVLKRHPDLAADPRVTFLCQLMDGEDDPKRCAALKLDHAPSRFFVQSALPDWITTGSSAVRFGAHLGYRDIGIVGIDCNYQEILPEAVSQGGVVLRIDKPVDHNPNYFFNDYQQPGDIYQIPNPVGLDGNLHRKAMATIPQDNITYGYGLDLHILTRESWLFEADILPYQPLDAFLGLG